MTLKLYYSDIETTKFKKAYELDNFENDSYELLFELGCIVSFDNNSEIDYEYYSFNQLDFCNELIKDCSKTNVKRIYFHNLRFDSKFLFEFLYNHFDKLKTIKANSKIISINCFMENSQHKFNKVLELRDSLSILLYSIKRLGKMVNLPKLEFDFDYSDNQKAINYCFQDCKIIYFALDYIVKFLNEYMKKNYSISSLPLTIGALSKKLLIDLYPTTFYKVDLKLEKTLRYLYFGGHTEPFHFKLFKNVVGLDFNSLYPSVLSKYDFAYGKVNEVFVNSINFDNKMILAFKCIICENQFYPLYPTRDKNGLVLFKNGFKEVLITKPEFNYLTENNYFSEKIRIVRVISMFVCKITGNFANYFETMYYNRKSFESEHPFNYILKILMNAGYGKFGQNPIMTNYEFLNHNQIDLDNLDNLNIYLIDGVFINEYEKFNLYLKINLLNAILTASYSRFELWKLLESCNNLNIPVIYSDTDSIYIENKYSELLNEYIDNMKLGFLKPEAYYDLFQSIDSKEYFCYNFPSENKKSETYIKFKGIKQEYINSIKKLISHVNKGTKVNLIGSFFYCLRRHSKFENVHIIKKHKHSYFKKRIIQKDLSTKPFISITKKQKRNNRLFILQQLFLLQEIINENNEI